MEFNNYINMLLENYDASENELSETLKLMQKKIINLHKKVKRAGYGDIAPKELEELKSLQLNAVKTYRDYVNSHMDTILLYPNVSIMYKAFTDVLKVINI